MKMPVPESQLLFSRKDLNKLIVPLLWEQVLAVLIGMADTMMVSSCGEASVSGVSLVDSVNILLIMVFSSMATGGAVVTSQYLGKRDLDSASKAAKQLFYVVLLISVAIGGMCLVFGNALLSMIFGSIEADVMDAARIYFMLSALSYPFLSMYNASAALLRAQGNAKATLYTSIVMNVINVAGNALTIYGFGWGVMGAGLATLISRIVGSIVIHRYLRKPECLLPCPVLTQFEWKPDLIGKILSIGIPNGLENGMFQLGKLLLLRMVSTFGTVSIAANAVANSICTFQVLPGSAVNLAMITVVGQCVGAKEFDQARYYTHKLMKLTYAAMSILNIILLFGNTLIVKPYNLSPETELLAREIIAIHGVGAITMWPMSFTLPNALRAAGDARFTMVISSISMLTFRICFGYLLAIPFGMGVIGVWVAMQIDWIFRIIHFMIRFHGQKWQTKAVV